MRTVPRERVSAAFMGVEIQNSGKRITLHCVDTWEGDEATVDKYLAFDVWAEQWRALGPDADAMDRVNPAVVPRNHLVEEALVAATDGDLEPFTRLVAAVTSPFDVRPGDERYTEPAPTDFGAYTTYCGT